MKTLIFLIVIFSIFTLSGCDVHFGSVHYDVPWWVIAVPVFIVILVAHLVLVHRTYNCPNCGYKIKPKWYQISIWVHVGNKRLVKCPNCGKKDMCVSK